MTARCAAPRCPNRARYVVADDEAYCFLHGSAEAWRAARAFVMERDRRTCRRCGAEAHDVHHLLTRGAHPFLRYEPRNLVALCRSCHDHAHGYPASLKVWAEEREPGIMTALMVRDAELERAGRSADLAEVIIKLRRPELTASDRARYEDGSWLG